MEVLDPMAEVTFFVTCVYCLGGNALNNSLGAIKEPYIYISSVSIF
jgi:hypothetical protein